MILVLNCGSQSIKWKVFDKQLKVVDEGKAFVFDSKNYDEFLQKELKKVSHNNFVSIGHRVVHGGELFTAPLKINEENLIELEKTESLAPLHNPYNIAGIKACLKLFPTAENIAFFDTEFFKDLPDYASTYALPIHIAKEFGFKRYGFHGTSHEFVSKGLEGKVITCHLGGGCSVAAIENGKAIDVSMGFTPMEGLVMMTRAGDIDSGIVLDLAESFGPEKTREILNKESGVKGICGQDDMLKVLAKVESGDSKAKLAFDVFVYSVKKYIGAYYAVLGGCDVLVFTGSIGSGDPMTREAICNDLDILKGVKILAVETDEELAIAQKIINL